MGCIFSFVCETSWRAGRITMQFSPCMLHVIYRKKPKKHKNYPGSPSLWKWVQSLKVDFFVIFCLQFLLEEFKQRSALMAWTIPSKILIECMVRALNYFVSMHHPHFVISPNQTDWLSEIYTVCFGWVFSTVERIISWNHNPGWIARRCCWAWKLRPRCSQCWPSMGPGELILRGMDWGRIMINLTPINIFHLWHVVLDTWPFATVALP